MDFGPLGVLGLKGEEFVAVGASSLKGCLRLGGRRGFSVRNARLGGLGTCVGMKAEDGTREGVAVGIA
jgi:hypothetical protein